MKRATAISLVGLGTGLVALYSFTGERRCTEPDPTSPLYQQQVSDYARCRSRRSSSSSSRSGSSWHSGTSTTSGPVSTASRGGFGGAGHSVGG